MLPCQSSWVPKAEDQYAVVLRPLIVTIALLGMFLARRKDWRNYAGNFLVCQNDKVIEMQRNPVPIPGMMLVGPRNIACDTALMEALTLCPGEPIALTHTGAVRSEPRATAPRRCTRSPRIIFPLIIMAEGWHAAQSPYLLRRKEVSQNIGGCGLCYFPIHPS